ncbi:hypothetical protein VTK73DRAFT_4432 [Phialemonium thermophilum]|uniref:Uncharacterized protein n=1 Tax=Phialemonium thermophilum TaxID=223376 RepID=A0ABR3V8U1_9PEZI
MGQMRDALQRGFDDAGKAEKVDLHVIPQAGHLPDRLAAEGFPGAEHTGVEGRPVFLRCSGCSGKEHRAAMVLHARKVLKASGFLYLFSLCRPVDQRGSAFGLLVMAQDPAQGAAASPPGSRGHTDESRASSMVSFPATCETLGFSVRI